MKPLNEYIKDLINGYFNDNNYFIVDVKTGSNDKIIVYVDKLEGHIEIATCAKLSRFLENDLETNNLVKEKYNLEVSSPGLDNAFKVHKQYLKNIGRTLEIWDKSNSKIEGILKTVNQNDISIDKIVKQKNKTEKVEMRLKFEDIVKTKVKISFKK